MLFCIIPKSKRPEKIHKFHVIKSPFQRYLLSINLAFMTLKLLKYIIELKSL